jgi:hypothetical protein
MRQWAVWAVGVALLAAAWIVVAETPDDEVSEQPFEVVASAGEAALAREFEVTLTNPRLGERAVDARGWSADGTWFVVDVEAEARFTERLVSLPSVWLVIDGVRYRASERPSSFLDAQLEVGLPQSGSFAFEVPEGLATRSAAVELGADTDTRLDSVVTLPVDLGSLEPLAEVELTSTGWAQ